MTARRVPDDDRFRAVRKAIADPGSITGRTQIPASAKPWESLPDWQARAVMEVIGPWLAPEVDDSERFQIAEARSLLAWLDAAGDVHLLLDDRGYALYGHLRNLLAVLDKIAPKGDSDA